MAGPGDPETTAADLLCHEVSGQSHGRYAKGVDLEDLREALEKMRYVGLDLYAGESEERWLGARE